MRGLRPIWTGLLYRLGGWAVKPAAAREHGKRYRPAVNATSTTAFVPPLPAGEGSGGADYRPNLLTARQLGPKFGPRSVPYALGGKQDMNTEHKVRSRSLRGMDARPGPAGTAPPPPGPAGAPLGRPSAPAPRPALSGRGPDPPPAPPSPAAPA